MITSAWQVQYPPLQPHDGGWLCVGDGHQLHWDCSGHPGAPAVLFVHGGPGAGCTPDDRRWFDPQRWRIVMLDQRGAGLSRASDLLHANDTPHLVADMEALRKHLGIDCWALFGGSWGSLLALAYAQQHRERVSALVLRGVFTGTHAESRWLYGAEGAAMRHPEAWQRLCAAAGVQPGMPLLQAMHTRLQSCAAEGVAAAHAWWHWEQDLMAAEGVGGAAPRKPLPDAAALAQARIGVHHARHGWFLPEGEMLARADTLRGVPGFIVQGARDLVTPPATAHALHAAWPGSQLICLPAAGHSSTQAAMAQALVNATDTVAAAFFHKLNNFEREETHDA